MADISDKGTSAQLETAVGHCGRFLHKDRIVRSMASAARLHKTYFPRDPNVVLHSATKRARPGFSRAPLWRGPRSLEAVSASAVKVVPGKQSLVTAKGTKPHSASTESNGITLKSIKIKLNPPTVKSKGKVGRPRKYPLGQGPQTKPPPKRKNKKRIWNVLPREMRPSLRSYDPTIATQPDSQTKTFVDTISPGWVPSYQNDWSSIDLIGLMDREYDHLSKCVCSASEGCEESCWNKTSQIECVPRICPQGEKNCGNRQIQMREKLLKSMLKASREDALKFNKDVNRIMMSANVTRSLGFEVVKAPNKGYGLVASQDLEPGTFIMEYTGLALTTEMARSFARRNASSSPHFYGLSIAEGIVLDSTTTGSEARFVNHSCSPNCIMEKWLVEGLPRIALFVGREKVTRGSELTYDYNFNVSVGAEPQVCRCGAPNCRGFIKKKSLSEVSVSANANVDAGSFVISGKLNTGPKRSAKAQIKRKKRTRIASLDESEGEAEFLLKTPKVTRKSQLCALKSKPAISRLSGPSSSDFSDGPSSNEEGHSRANRLATRSERYSARSNFENTREETLTIRTVPSTSDQDDGGQSVFRSAQDPSFARDKRADLGKSSTLLSLAETTASQMGVHTAGLTTQKTTNNLILEKLAEISTEICNLRSEVASLKATVSELVVANTNGDREISPTKENLLQQLVLLKEPTGTIDVSSFQVKDNSVASIRKLLDSLQEMASKTGDPQEEADETQKWQTGPIYQSGRSIG